MYNTDYLLMSQKRFENQRREFTMDGIQVFIKDKITNDINLKNVLDIINSYIPRAFLKEIDSIYVGMFDDFIKKDVNAAYKDGAIYISNEQQSEQDLIDDIVHEIAHSLEQPYGYIIYADSKVEDEFLLKRKKLYDILKSEDLKPNLKLFLDLEYIDKHDLSKGLLLSVGSDANYCVLLAQDKAEIFLTWEEANALVSVIIAHREMMDAKERLGRVPTVTPPGVGQTEDAN